MSSPFWNEVLRNPVWIFAAFVGVAVVIGAVAGLIMACRHRHPAWERLHGDMTDLVSHQLAVFNAMVGIIQSHDPTAAQRAEALATYEDVDRWLLDIFKMRPRTRLTSHYNLLLRYFNAEWWMRMSEDGYLTEEVVASLIQSSSTPKDVAEHIRTQLEEARVMVESVPDYPRQMFEDTSTMAALTDDLADAHTRT